MVLRIAATLGSESAQRGVVETRPARATCQLELALVFRRLRPGFDLKQRCGGVRKGNCKAGCPPDSEGEISPTKFGHTICRLAQDFQREINIRKDTDKSSYLYEYLAHYSMLLSLSVGP